MSHRKTTRRKSETALLGNPSNTFGRRNTTTDTSSAMTPPASLSAPSANTPPSGSRAKRRWIETLRVILHDQDEKKRRSARNLMIPSAANHADKQDSKDEVGEHVARTLNHTTEFSWKKEFDDQASLVSMNTGGQETNARFVGPILSARNIGNFKRWFARIEWAPQEMIPTLAGFMKNSWFSFTRYRTTLRTSLQALGLLLAFSIGMTVFLFFRITIWFARSVFTLVSFLMSLLVDLEELQACCPKALVWTWALLLAVGRLIDRTFLLGGWVGGRDWDRDTHLTIGGPCCPSRLGPLWKCPPPYTVKLGRRDCMDAEELTRAEPHWSNATIHHVMAIHFCYIMMHDEFRRKQAKREYSKRRDSSFTHKSSGDWDLEETREGESESIPTKGSEMSMSDLSKTLAEGDCDSSSDEMDLLLPQLDLKTTSSQETQQRSGGRRRPRIQTLSVADGPGVEEIEVIEGQRSSLGNRIARSRSHADVLENDRRFLDPLLELEDDGHRSQSSSPSTQQPESPPQRHRRSSSHGTTLTNDSDFDDELDWLDVGTRIGMRLLNSEHIQRAVASQDTAERIMDISKQVENSLMQNGIEEGMDAVQIVEQDSPPYSPSIRSVTGHFSPPPPPKPIHSMWTSPISASKQNPSISGLSDDQDTSVSLISRNEGRMVRVLQKDQVPSSPVEINSVSDAIGIDDHSEAYSGAKSAQERLFESAELQNPSPGPNEVARKDIQLSLLSTPFEADRCDDSSASVSPSRLSNRTPLLPEGVKIVVPIFPLQPGNHVGKGASQTSSLQMGTVVSSRRILVRGRGQRVQHTMGYTNCLSITTKLDRSFLRNGEFAELTLRVMDEWDSHFMPRHSKFPVGTCVATTFGVGVLVGWRVEDDCHVVRSLWTRRAPGAGYAYLNREALHGVVVAAVGFNVQTPLGHGMVVAYTNGGKDFRHGRYFVQILEDGGRHHGKILEFQRSDILSCDGARFVPVIEHIREAAAFQIRVDTYESALRRQAYHGNEILSRDEKLRRLWSRGAETIWASLLKALEEDRDFDDGMNEFVSSLIAFLDRLEEPEARMGASGETPSVDPGEEKDFVDSHVVEGPQDHGAWLLTDVFGGALCLSEDTGIEHMEPEPQPPGPSVDSYERVYSVIRVLMRATNIARASSPDQPNLRLGLSACYEFLLFVRTVVRVQQKNTSPHSMEVWKLAVEEIASILGPVKERVENIGLGIAERMERQGKRAKVRILRFVDIVLLDEDLLQAVASGDWSLCLERLEDAMVKARIMDEDSRENYHKTILFIYGHVAPTALESDANKVRSDDILHHFALALTLLASPRRSILKFICQDDVLEILERVLVRVFHHHKDASRMLTIHAASFQTVRQLRMLKDFSFAAKLWIPLLDAADAEFSCVVSKMSGQAHDLLRPVAMLLSMYVRQCHKIADGNLTIDWLDFLMEDDAVKLIQEIDMKLIALLGVFSRHLKEFMVVLPYYPSIDDDILNLMDEVDLDEFLREASDAIGDSERLAEFIRQKSTIAVERFLDYLPKMSIPVDRRDVGDGWVLTCRGENGGDLTLSDVDINRENLTCQVLGSDNLFFPMFGDDTSDVGSASGSSVLWGESLLPSSTPTVSEVSVLDQIRDVLLHARNSGYWLEGVGGVDKTPSDSYVASVLQGLPVTSVLDCAIELWRNLEMDDDELMEIVILDVSCQMKLVGALPRESADSSMVGNNATSGRSIREEPVPMPQNIMEEDHATDVKQENWRSQRHRRFNPRVDPTVLFLEMRNLTLSLDRFHFRIEKAERRTIFDPIFEGRGTVYVRNIRIKLRVECKKRRMSKLRSDPFIPFLHVKDLEVGLEKVKFKVKDTGADWLLNSLVKGLSRNITEAVEENLQEQVTANLDSLMENLNSHFVVNPDLMLSILGITMGDLEESTIWPEGE